MSSCSTITTSTTTMNSAEADEWAEAEQWVREQVLINFRHRAITSRLLMPKPNNEPEFVLRLILPPDLATQSYLEEPQAIAQYPSMMETVHDVRMRIKRMEQMKMIDSQLKLHKRRRWPRVIRTKVKYT